MIEMLMSAWAAAAAPTYEIDLELARQDGELRHVSSWRTQAAIRDGEFMFSRKKEGADPVLRGEFDVDEARREVAASFEICRPGADPCDVLASPSLTFRLGEPSRLEFGVGEYSIKMSFTPSTE